MKSPGTGQEQGRSDYERVAAAIEYLESHAREQPALEDVAGAVGLSPHHFHRLFRRWAGITPKRFLQLLTLEEAKRRLDASRSVLLASWDAGLSGPSRLHDLFVGLDGMTPGEYRNGGSGVEIRYGFAATPFGRALLARTDRGLCRLVFLEAGDEPERSAADDPAADDPATKPTDADERAVAELRAEWPEAVLRRDDGVAGGAAAAIFRGDRLPLHVRGTNFQVKVWEALLTVPEGRVVCYEDVARAIGRPAATRAVAGAVARNRIGWLIPCHRVIRKVGEAGGYRWGRRRKRAMLAWEAARSE